MLGEEELYKNCLSGNEAAKKELFERFLPAMHAICIRYVRTKDDADDLIQEGFIKVFQKLETFSWKGNGSLVSWIKTIFINTAISRYRKDASKNEISLEDNYPKLQEYTEDETTDTVIEQALEFFSQEDIIQCIAELPENFRIVFNLFALEGYKHREIASFLNISVKTSTTRYLRAKSRLKVILSKKLNKTLIVKR